MNLAKVRARVAEAAAARVAAAEAAAMAAARVPGVTTAAADGAVRLTGRGLVARAFGSRRTAADPRLAGLATEIARQLSSGGV
ncbi:hypothetical protein IP88_03895 [alpha proteobacterium AAP81b]|nr:hypothetical protein IP88_03895 [alpha proteobacterium AAP81b]